MNPKEIGRKLKDAREKRGLSIEGVYKATRMQPSVIAAIEEGKAEERLDRIYLLLFVKKYAFFLGLDGESLAASCKSFYARRELTREAPSEKAPPVKVSEAEKWLTPAAFGALAFICIFFILLFGIKLKFTRKIQKPITSSRRAPRAQAAVKESAFPIAQGEAIELSLRSTDRVWMKVKKDGKVIFEGTLNKNKQKNFYADDKIELWAGRAEALEITVNGKALGVIGKGNIKNILISRRGLKVGKKWLTEKNR